MKDFYTLFIQELQNIYSLEKQVIKALSHLARQTSSKKLRKVLSLHVKETLKQIVRIEEIASEFNEKLCLVHNHTSQKILQEIRRSAQFYDDPETADAAIIMGFQKLKHYELASYGNLKSFAKHFKIHHILELLEESSKEEGHMDKKLTEIAEGTFFDTGVNARARKKCA